MKEPVIHFRQFSAIHPTHIEKIDFIEIFYTLSISRHNLLYNIGKTTIFTTKLCQ